ncbi:GxxExxY protein, partial [Pollutibacter soli]|uniref:GxxExxY protein n=1 Tax=Pollutibacter soli TaxID=3034157 RepID=UPI003014044B
MTENEISYLIRGCVFNVYNELGPGLLESVYKVALAFELNKAGLKAYSEVPLPVVYKGIKLECGFRMDIVVNDLVLVEIKSVESLANVHHLQMLTYLKLSGKRLGL